MGTSQSKDSKTEGSVSGIDPNPCQTMNPSDQRSLLPPPPSLYTSSNDTASASQGSYGTPTMQGLPPLGGYTGSSQSYSHIPINPVPGPAFHKIAQPMRPQEPVVSQQSMYQQYPQQGYAQSSYSQSFPQQLYPHPHPPHSYQSSFSSSNPMHSMQQQYMQPHIPYQQSATTQSHTSPQKYDIYQQPFKSEQMSQSQQPVPPVAKPQTSVQPLPQGFQPPHAGQQSYPAQPLAQSQPSSSVYQPPAGDANSPQSQHQMQPPQKPSTPPNQIQQNREAASVMPTPPSDSAQSDTSDVPPGSPEIKLTIKKTFDKGRPRLTSSLVRKDGSDRTDAGSGNELSRERELVEDSPHADDEAAVIPADPAQADPVISKPKTVAQKRENFKAGKANTLPKTTLQTNPPSTSFDEKPCEWLVGDLVWSKVTGHPWWPCMVAYDPNLGIYTRMKGAYGKSYRMYHVQFFGEVPERGWVSGCSMRKFTGKSQYNELVQELVSKIKKKTERARLTAKLALKPSRKSAWEASVVECEKALPMSRHERKLKFTFKYEIPKSAMGNLTTEQIDVVSLGDSPKMKAKRAYKKQQDSEAAAATCTTKASSQDPTQPQTASLPTPTGSAPSDLDNHNLSLAPRAKRKYRKRKSNTSEPSPVPESPRSKRKRGRKSAQFLEFCSKRQDEMASQHPEMSKAEIYASLENEWDEMPEDKKAKIVTSPAPTPPRPARKRKVKEASPDSDLVVKRSRRETKPSKKLQEADLDNLGFSPKMTKSLKLNEVEKADKRGKVAGTMSPPPSQAFTKHASSRGKSKKRDASLKKKEGRRSKHLTNGATVLSRVPVKAVKSGGEAIATEMSKDFAEMQEDEPGLIIDTDLITGAIESAGDGQETTNGVPFSVSGNNASLSFCNFSI